MKRITPSPPKVRNPKSKSKMMSTLLNRGKNISHRTLHKILHAGILLFSLVIILMYSTLLEFENANDTTMQGGRSSSSTKRSGNTKKKPFDPDWWKKNNNIENPGRGYGSERGKIKCDQDIHKMVSYWNDPRSEADLAFESPFLEAPSAFISLPKKEKTRYLSFEPDLGGWNNIRMEFEIMVVLAAATGRTLVMPPDNPLYLLNKEKGNKRRGLQNFFHDFTDVVDIISTEELFQKESLALPTDEQNRTKVSASLEECDWRAKSDQSCLHLYDHLAQIADYVPDWHGEHHCLIMDDQNWHTYHGSKNADAKTKRRIDRFCAQRTPIYYNRKIHDAPLLHFRSHIKETRLLVHFYAFVYFTKPKIDNYYKRLARDRVRYTDEIFCAAGKIVTQMVTESFFRHKHGGGAEAGYFSMHIRRGDFQWPKMKLSAEEWHENTKHWLTPDDDHVLYIATDENDRSWFDPLKKHYKLRFLEDFKDLIGLDKLDPNYIGMIDQIVASRGRDFVGTYFSSFSAYIGRMRGYRYISGKRMFYSHPDYWNETHSWVYPHKSYSAREYPLGWLEIDEDYEQNGQDFF